MKFGKDNLTRLTGDQRLGQNRDSEYLGAEDVDPGTEPILTIEGLYNGMTTTQKGKENHDVLCFVEKSVAGLHHVRPLIVNSTNRKTLRKLFGSAQAKVLEGKQIQLYIDHNVRNPEDGGKTDGIRIRPYAPRVQQQPAQNYICTECHKPVQAYAGKSAQWMAAYTSKHYGAVLCFECAQKRKQAAADAEQQAAAETVQPTAEQPTMEAGA